MVNLSQYVNKRVKVTFRSNRSLEGSIGLVKNEGPTSYPYSFRGSTYTQNGRWFEGQDCENDIVSIESLEKPMNNKVNLSEYLGKEITATLRSGGTLTSTVTFNSESTHYPYRFGTETYTEHGYWVQENESSRDIVHISCPEDEPQQQPSSIYSAWLDNNLLCAFPTRQEVKDYIKQKYSDIDPLDIAILTETFVGNPLK